MTSASTAGQRRELAREEWGPYFAELTRRLEDGLELEAAVEVTSEATDGTEAQALPLVSITYEKHDDQIAIALGGRGSRFPAALWHYVDHPTLVWVREEGDVPAALGIEGGDEDHTYTFVRLDSADGRSRQ
jgi:hypothetical protein